jgi:predicted nuclease of predicted toxin-antitoxin system
MLRYLADEDFDNRILNVFRRREADLDWVRVQDLGLSGTEDEVILQYAPENQRIVLTGTFPR